MGFEIWTWIFVSVIVLAGLFFAVMLILWLMSKPVKAELLRYNGRWFPVAVYRVGEAEYRNIFPDTISQTHYFPAGIVRTVRKSRFFGFVIDRSALATIITGAVVLIPTAVILIMTAVR